MNRFSGLTFQRGLIRPGGITWPGLTLALLLAGALLFLALTACGSGAAAKPTPPSSVSAEAVPPPAAPASDAPATASPVVNTGSPGAGPAGGAAPQNAAPQAATPAPADANTPTPGEVVAAYEAALIGIYRDTLPSIVKIRVSVIPEETSMPPQFEDFLPRGEGSGFLWDDAGHVVTNHHVISDAEEIRVFFADGTQTMATVVGSDGDSDLAVILLEEMPDSAVPVRLGDSGAVQVGQLAVAIGAPFGQEFTMTTGIVSGVGRVLSSQTSQFSIPEVIQTDAAVNPGNSGGPLLDRLGRVIGVNTQIISHSGVNAGVGMAVPVNLVRRVAPALIEDGKYEYSWLGISGSGVDRRMAEILELPADTRGALVLRVVDDSPADEAGLRGSDGTATIDGMEYPTGGDVIIAIDGSPVVDMTDLISYLTNETTPGDEVELTVIGRDGDEAALEVTLGTRPE